MKAVKHYRSALTRQIGEAVRIRRRGERGSILNSKAEYDRCHIPRLVVEEQDQKQMKKFKEAEKVKLRAAMEQVEQNTAEWSHKRSRQGGS